MRISTFNSGKGLIHGKDSMRIGCDIAGTFKTGDYEVRITPDADAVMPILYNGGNGLFSATFISDSGIEYELASIRVKGGRIVPPPQTEVELMELRLRLDILESMCDDLKSQIRELSNIFDTDSLNFLIN